MGKFEVIPEYSEEMDKLTTGDKGHPDTFNPKYQQLLNNDAYIKKQMEAGLSNAVQGEGLTFFVDDEGILNVTYDDGTEEGEEETENGEDNQSS